MQLHNYARFRGGPFNQFGRTHIVRLMHKQDKARGLVTLIKLDLGRTKTRVINGPRLLCVEIIMQRRFWEAGGAHGGRVSGDAGIRDRAGACQSWKRARL